MEQKTYAVLVTVDRAYIPPLQVMLRSLLRVHPENAFDLYLLHSSLEKADLDAIAAGLPDGRCRETPGMFSLQFNHGHTALALTITAQPKAFDHPVSA